jgi:hypothetical protein
MCTQYCTPFCMQSGRIYMGSGEMDMEEVGKKYREYIIRYWE